MVKMCPHHYLQISSLLFSYMSCCPYPDCLALAYKKPTLVEVQNKVLVTKVTRLLLG